METETRAAAGRMARGIVLATAALLAGCGATDGTRDRDPLAAVRGAHDALGRSAAAAMADGRWADAERALGARLAHYPTDPGAAGAEKAVDLYNLACARALLGRKAEALDALELSLRADAGAVGFDHARLDPDLDSLAEEPRFRALLDGLAAGEVVWTVPDAAARPGAVDWVVLAAPGGRGGGGHPLAALPAPFTASVTVLHGGGRPAPARDRSPRLSPGAAAAGVPPRGDDAGAPRRRVLVGTGRDAAAAWEILAAEPGAFDAAVFDGPPPRAWRLLDRGLERFPGRILVTPGNEPPPVIPHGTVEEFQAALDEAAS